MNEKQKIALFGGIALIVIYFVVKGSGSGNGASQQPAQVIYPRYSSINPVPADQSRYYAQLQADAQKKAQAIRLFEDALQYRLYNKSIDLANRQNSGAMGTQQAAANQSYFDNQDYNLQNMAF